VPPLNLVADFGGGSMFLVFGILAALSSARSRATVSRGCAMGRWRAGDDGVCCTECWLAAGVEQRGRNLLDGGATFYRTYRNRRRQVHFPVGALEPEFVARSQRASPAETGESDDPERSSMAAMHARYPQVETYRTKDPARAPTEMYLPSAVRTCDRRVRRHPADCGPAARTTGREPAFRATDPSSPARHRPWPPSIEPDVARLRRARQPPGMPNENIDAPPKSAPAGGRRLLGPTDGRHP